MGAHRYVRCDVFAERPLEGNPLCVFTDARGLDPGRMQQLARETNLSETAFVLPPAGDGDFALRIFTPTRELPIAGHPTIGTAVVIGRSLALDRLVLETGVGPIEVDLVRADGAVAGAVMGQPEPSFSRHPQAAEMRQALGLGDGRVEVGDNGVRVGLTEAPDEASLAALRPDLARLAALDGLDVLSVFVPGDPVRVRVFCPWAGIAEDPGTGVAAGPLAVLLGRSLTVLQGVEIGRPSRIDVELRSDGGPRVGGAVSLVGRGFYDI